MDKCNNCRGYYENMLRYEDGNFYCSFACKEIKLKGFRKSTLKKDFDWNDAKKNLPPDGRMIKEKTKRKFF